MIQPVTPSNLMQAAAIHAESWQASHREICTPEFLALHTPERQARYLASEMKKGARLYERHGFQPTGNTVQHTGGLYELELQFCQK